MTNEEAVAKIAELKVQFINIINEMTDIADEHNIELWLNHIYGMGGRYLPKNSTSKDKYDSEYSETEGYWVPSSEGC